MNGGVNRSNNMNGGKANELRRLRKKERYEGI
jgi:hypothetical protein